MAFSCDIHAAFGLSSKTSSNIFHLDDETVVFPCGSTVVILNGANNRYRFIVGQESSKKIESLAVSPNRRYLAVSEMTSPPSISVYDLHSLKRRKVISASEETNGMSSMCFSPDSRYLATLSCSSEWKLSYWAWEKGNAPLASIKCTPDVSLTLDHVTFNPQDNTQMCISGEKTLKMYRYTDGQIKQMTFAGAVEWPVTGQTWLTQSRVAVALADGRIIVFEGSDIKFETKLDEHNSSIASYKNGFICGTTAGNTIIFQLENDQYVQRSSHVVGVTQVDNDNEDDDKSEEQTGIFAVTSMSVSPSEDRIVCSTSNSQLFYMYMPTIATQSDLEIKPGVFKRLAPSFHEGAITSVDVALRKPLVATTGADKSVRIWNYEDKTLELLKYFPEEGHSIAIHPTGLLVLVAFSDKLRLMNVLLDDIRTLKEFSIREAKDCKFSHGGHLFAATRGNVVQVFSTWTFESVASLKGHNGRVRSISWSPDDSTLITAGIDGAIYKWDVLKGIRIGENVKKSCHYTSAVMSPDGENVFAVGSDKLVKEISGDNNIADEADAKLSSGDELTMSQVQCAGSGRGVFSGTLEGSIIQFKRPFGNDQDLANNILALHQGPITKMAINFESTFLFTVGQDGSLFMIRLTDKEGRNRLQTRITFGDEILISKADYQERMKLISELKHRVEELKMSGDYQVRLKDMSHKETVKDLTSRTDQERESLKQQIMMLRSELERQQARHDEESAQLLEHHAIQMQKIEQEQSQKLLNEYEKYQKLQTEATEMEENYEQTIEQMKESFDAKLGKTVNEWEAKVSDRVKQHQRHQQQSQAQANEYEEMQRQIELDADEEILALKLDYESKLKAAHDEISKLKDDNGILSKKMSSLKKEMAEEATVREEMQVEQQRLQAHVRALEREIASIKKEMVERDEAIQEKEKRISDLKKKNQELEKFKFVLDYKIQELKKQAEPKDKQIAEMDNQIGGMDGELSTYQKQTQGLELKLHEVELKLKANQKEQQKDKEKISVLNTSLNRMRSEIEAAVAKIQQPKALASAVQHIYRKHCKEAEIQDDVEGDTTNAEHQRQRQFLEKNMTSVKRKMARLEQEHKTEITKIMKENVELISEINRLRKELQGSKASVQKLEGTLKTTRTLAGMRGQTLPDKEDVVLMSGTLGSTLRRDTEREEHERLIEMQKDEIRKLRDTVDSLQRLMPDRPPSTGRLPPLEQSKA